MKLTLRTQLEIKPLPPFDFRLTVRKPAGWSLFTSEEFYDKETLWTGIRSEGRPVGLRIESRGTVESPRIRVGLHAGSQIPRGEEERLRGILSVCLGAEQDLRGFYEFARKDGILKHVAKSLYGMHDTQGVALFNSVILAICLQMARLQRSRQMMDAIDREYGETIEFDRRKIVLQPTAGRIARLDPAVLARGCKLGYRAKYIVASAKMIESGFPEIQDIMKMPPEMAKEELMKLPGIGDYAADIINPHAGFPIDAWSVDVFGVLFFGKQPENRRKAIEEVKQEGIRRWGKWSWMAFFYVAQDLQNLSDRLGVKLRLE